MSATASLIGEPTATKGFFVLLAIVGLALGSWSRDRRRAPWLPCKACGGRGRRDSTWRASAWGACPKCGGKARRPRTRRSGDR